jgi:hypothetical protein
MSAASNEQVLQAQNGTKVFIQQISVSTSAAVTAINTTTAAQANYVVNTAAGAMNYGAAIPIPKGATLCLQPDSATNVNYNLCPVGSTTSVTVSTGSFPGTYVQGGQQEFVIASEALCKPGATPQLAIDVIASAAGKLNVYLVLP